MLKTSMCAIVDLVNAGNRASWLGVFGIFSLCNAKVISSLAHNFVNELSSLEQLTSELKDLEVN